MLTDLSKLPEFKDILLSRTFDYYACPPSCTSTHLTIWGEGYTYSYSDGNDYLYNLKDTNPDTIRKFLKALLQSDIHIDKYNQILNQTCCIDYYKKYHYRVFGYEQPGIWHKITLRKYLNIQLGYSGG